MDDRRRIVFDNKIPLTWLISSGATILLLLTSLLWTVAHQSDKLDELVSQAAKNERRTEELNSKMESFIKDSYDSKRTSEILGIRIDALEKAKSK